MLQVESKGPTIGDRASHRPLGNCRQFRGLEGRTVCVRGREGSQAFVHSKICIHYLLNTRLNYERPCTTASNPKLFSFLGPRLCAHNIYNKNLFLNLVNYCLAFPVSPWG